MPAHKPLFSCRTEWELSPNQIFTTLENLRKDNVTVFDLTESNPTRCGLNYPQEIFQSLANEGNLQYDPSPKGSMVAREAISHYYKTKNIKVDPAQIFLTSSTSEAYSFLFRLLVNPQETVMFPRPSYPLFSFLGDLNDIKMDTYPLMSENQWAIDVVQLKKNIHPATKVLVTVNPNNPTGSCIQKKELEALNNLCAQHNMALISDEVFWDFASERREEAVSLAGNDAVLTFTLGGLSKVLGLPQMKLSWIIVSGPEAVVQEAQNRLEVIADTYLSVNTPAQNALDTWLSLKDSIQDKIITRLKHNREFLMTKIQSVPNCQLIPSEGGWYVVLKIPNSQTEEKWVMDFLTQDNVFVHPGYFFDFQEEGFIILSLLPKEDVFSEGVRRIFQRLERD